MIPPKDGRKIKIEKKINLSFPPSETFKKNKSLNTKELNIKEKQGKSIFSHLSPHKNPNEYNGEVLGNQVDTPKNTNNKQVLREPYGLVLS